MAAVCATDERIQGPRELRATDAARLFKPWVGSREKGMVEVYDPKIEVVICFVRKGDEDKTEIDCYTIKTRPTPPDAAEQE